MIQNNKVIESHMKVKTMDSFFLVYNNYGEITSGNRNTCCGPVVNNSGDNIKVCMFLPCNDFHNPEQAEKELKEWLAFGRRLNIRVKYEGIDTLEKAYSSRGCYMSDRKYNDNRVMIVSFDSVDLSGKLHTLECTTFIRYFYSLQKVAIYKKTIELKEKYPLFSEMKCFWLAHAICGTGYDSFYGFFYNMSLSPSYRIPRLADITYRRKECNEYLDDLDEDDDPESNGEDPRDINSIWSILRNNIESSNLDYETYKKTMGVSISELIYEQIKRANDTKQCILRNKAGESIFEKNFMKELILADEENRLDTFFKEYEHNF